MLDACENAFFIIDVLNLVHFNDFPLAHKLYCKWLVIQHRQVYSSKGACSYYPDQTVF